MNMEEHNIRIAAIYDKVNQLAAQFAQLANDIRAAVVPSGSNRTTLEPAMSEIENLNAQAPVQAPVVLEFDPIPEAIPMRMEEENNRRLAKLEEKFRAMQGYEASLVDDLSRYTRINFPEKFRIPEFVRYDGTGDPKIHLKYYLNRMGMYAHNVPLLIQTFQESLCGPALQWYILLESERMERWEEVAEAFVLQYKYNTEIALTRDMLARTEKKRSESFRSFAQRWRTIAAQVKPPLDDKEMIELFLRTLPQDFYDRMIGSGCDTFSRLVTVGERIEGAMQDGRINEGASRKFPIRKDKEVEVAYVQAPIESRAPPNVRYPSNRVNQNYGAKRRAPRQFTPLSKPLSELLPVLLTKQMIAKEVPRNNPPKFVGFDMAESCEYHMGERGHNVDNCMALKVKVQDLLDKGILVFENSHPNVQQDPIPNEG